MIAPAVLLVGLSAVPPYVYRGQSLELDVGGLPVDQPIEARWGVLPDEKGRAKHVVRSRADDTGVFTLKVGTAGAHEVVLRAKNETRRFLTTRGTWYSLPRSSRWQISMPDRAAPRAPWDPKESIIAGTFGARLAEGVTHEPPQFGRTFGLDDSASLDVLARNSVVIVASATSQGFVVTITEPKPPDVRYWDIPLNLTSSPRRYVLPLRRFVARDGRPGWLERIGAISLTGVDVAKEGDLLRIETMGMLESTPRIGNVRRKKRRIDIELENVRPKGTTLHVRGATGTTDTTIVVGAKRQVRLPLRDFGDKTDVWLCTESPAGTSCDPPDAPITTYAIPPAPGGELLIDDFKGSTWLNTSRLPTSVFTSTIGYAATRFASRRPGRVRIGDPDDHALAYVGYTTPMPPRAPKKLLRLKLEVRGRGAAEKVFVGLRDKKGNEPKRPLPVPLDGQWHDAVFVLGAMQTPNAYEALTVTVLEDADAEQSLDIRRISLIP